jgi:alpha-tubulin suppressor-like RCC1 family protein
VPWLDGIPQGPIVKISAGGYTLGALTKGGDLYIWGQRTGSCRPLVADLSGEPTPIDLDEDVSDFAIGYQHAILLTTRGEVLVRGSNRNGQLGLGKQVERADGWTKVHVPGPVVAVEAGDKTSFILIRQADNRDALP